MHAIICNCFIAAPLSLSTIFFQSTSNVSLYCAVKSLHCFHLGLQSLTLYSFVSIKTQEHCAVFGFEVVCGFV